MAETPVFLNSEQFQGYQGSADQPSAVLLKNNNLHAEIQIDPESFGGSNRSCGY